MATGPGLGNLLPVAMTLIGLVTMLRTRNKRRNRVQPGEADTEADTAAADRRAAAVEMERRMASYLAQRETGRAQGAADEQNGQENGR